MNQNNDIIRGRHCVFMMHVHLVFVTKYRRDIFTKEILDILRPIFLVFVTILEQNRLSLMVKISCSLISELPTQSDSVKIG